MENGEDCRKVASGFPPSLSQSKNSSRRVSSTDRSESEDYENFLLGKSGTITGAYVLHRRDTSTRRRLSSIRKTFLKRRRSLTDAEMRGLRYVFSILDQNKDGVIAAGELLLTLRALNVTLTEAELNDVIAELDVDLNGTVDYDELCLFVGYRIVMKNLENELDQFIQALDADGDGRVGRKDVRRIMRHFHLPDDKEHIDELFQIIPAAHMDYVTIAELRKFIHPSENQLNLRTLFGE
ncbi:hypothetical protein FBUS_04303 [Fasciolopsis buskii]|uniref:EF-hand domain-containing protein n=1 Tax=Fasciolopsis buskii TaxID=27845 RepID=A0A8E0RWL9_9TREM|nr:hypothetical protein FBUS_04303 [Fasciolopsis buski]